MINNAISKKALQAIIQLANNKEAAKAVNKMFSDCREEVVRSLIVATDPIDIYKCQGQVSAIEELQQLFKTPQDFKQLVEDE